MTTVSFSFPWVPMLPNWTSAPIDFFPENAGTYADNPQFAQLSPSSHLLFTYKTDFSFVWGNIWNDYTLHANGITLTGKEILSACTFCAPGTDDAVITIKDLTFETLILNSSSHSMLVGFPAVPETSTWLMFAIGFSMLALCCRGRRQHKERLGSL